MPACIGQFAWPGLASQARWPAKQSVKDRDPYIIDENIGLAEYYSYSC